MADARLEQLDYYTLLGVDDADDVAVIKRAFKKFARKYHPDRFAGAPTEKRERAAAIYRRGSEAYQVLTDEIAREAYDDILAQHGRTRLSPEEIDRAHHPASTEPTRRRLPIHTPAARELFKQAVEASYSQDWLTAWRCLKTALEYEPGNQFLQMRFGHVDDRIRQGDY